MGTTVEAWSSTQADVVATQEWFALVEDRCSRFIESSELSRLNRDERDRVPLSSLLAGALEQASRARRITGGLVDAGLGANVISWGYDSTFEEIVGLDRAPETAGGGGEWWIEGHELVREPGTLMDLGGIGKGWACDVAVERGLATVISAGGDIRSHDEATSVPIVDPWGETATVVHLGIGGLATSSTTRRSWPVGGGSAHHLIDPRTSAPAVSPILSATVVAETAADAEAGAKAVLILGEEGLAWAEGQSWIRSAIVVWETGSVFATNGVEVTA